MALDPVLTADRQCRLIDELRALPAETPWVEFKENNDSAPVIGKLISALGNSARLADKAAAYVVWGLRDGDHAPVGTSFDPASQIEQRQPLEFWLSQRLSPAPDIRFDAVAYQGHRLVLLTIPAAITAPIEFERTAFIRIGSATPRLADHPERQRTLWGRLQSHAWEADLAAEYLTGDEVLERLDYASYFTLTGQPLPDNRQAIFARLVADRLVARDVGGRWNVTNLGAILFARRLGDFSPSLERKAVRFVAYDGPGRADRVTHRQDGQRGYAVGMQGLVDFIDGLLPRNEHIGAAFREERPLYPATAIRELIANALIHQDMTIRGSGPLVELFSDRMEILNPGAPLVSPDRFLDAPPRSRNEAVAALMRRMRLCEEQGTGIDKVLTAVERHQLPPPDFRMEGEAAVRVVFFAPRSFTDMTREERVRACYQHAGLMYEAGSRMTNTTLRQRLDIDARNASQASVIIRQALEAGLIRAADPDHPRAGYVPAWA